jgi:glutaredoxin
MFSPRVSLRETEMKIEVVGKNNCMYCVMAQELLKKEGAEYTYKKLETDISISELRERVPGIKSVPAIFINDEFIGGYTSLESYFRNGKN